MTAKKMGRPTENPKNAMERFRIDAETKRKLEACSEVLKISKSEVLRKGVHRIYDELDK